MWRYIAKRTLLALGIILCISLITFIILNVIPGDVAAMMLGDFATQDNIAQLRENMGLNRPLPVQYVSWLGGIVRGDFGTSYFQNRPVLELINISFHYTVVIAVSAYVVAVVLGLSFGILAATHRGSVVDRLVMHLSVLGISAPSFWVAILLQLYFGLRLKWFPISGAKYALWFVLPAFALGTRYAASISRITRTSMLEVMGQDYIRTCYAKGLNRFRVTIVHVFRNALIPVITILGNDFGALLTGSMITEKIFNIPGVGKMLIDAINRRDIPLVQGGVIYVAIICVVVYFAVDILYAVINPNIRLTKDAN